MANLPVMKNDQDQQANPGIETSSAASSAQTGRLTLVGPVTVARALLVAVLVAGVYFFHGFIVPVLAALVIGFASWPLYRRLLAMVNGSRMLGATIAIFLIVTLIVIPVFLASAYAIKEIRVWVYWAIEANKVGAPVPVWLAALPIIGTSIAESWVHYVGTPGGLGELVQTVSGSNIGAIYRGVITAGTSAVQALLTLLFMLISLFFVYLKGEMLVGQLDKVGERILPERWERVSRIVPQTISSTVTGMTIIAIGEGIVLGIAYWLAGVPSPVTLGLLTGLAALIPGGAPVSFTLVSAYLAASGSVIEGVALFLWGTTELFIVDKTLRPKLVGGPIKLPFLPTFFGLIGGVKTMGFLGLFVGPVLMALLVAIWREWVLTITEEEMVANQTTSDKPSE